MARNATRRSTVSSDGVGRHVYALSDALPRQPGPSLSTTTDYASLCLIDDRNPGAAKADDERSFRSTQLDDLSSWSSEETALRAIDEHEEVEWARFFLDALPTSALVLDGDSCILAASSSAKQMLAANDGLRQDERGKVRASLTCEFAGVARLIAEGLARARSETAAPPSAAIVRRPSEKAPLLLVAAPLKRRPRCLDAKDDGARLLLQIIDPIEQFDDRDELLHQAYGLTAREARIAVLIGCGMGNPEVAAMLGISINTVRTHLARCFDKMGVRSQGALIRLVASLRAAS